jgi:hypothetical protein
VANRLFRGIARGAVAVGKVVAKIWQRAEKLGLNDELLALALKHVKEVALIHASNDERREYVVRKLQELLPNLPERVIRIAIELAVDEWKANG